MSFDQLKNYVSSQRMLGSSDEAITKSLREKHWHDELITKALTEVASAPKPGSSEVDLSTRLLSVSELLTASWSTLSGNFITYVLSTIAMFIGPMIVFIIFIAPIIYDVAVLHFTVSDFLSKSMIPIVVLHGVLGLLTLVLVALWSKLALYTTIVHGGRITLHQAFKRAWERLPGYTLVGVLTALVIIVGLLFFILPGIIFSVYLTFATLGYVVHGARGKSALLGSITLVHGRWWKTFWRILALGLIAFLVATIAASILPGIGGMIAQIIMTPFAVIYAYILYNNYVAFDKAHPKEEKIDVAAVTAEVKEIER